MPHAPTVNFKPVPPPVPTRSTPHFSKCHRHGTGQRRSVTVNETGKQLLNTRAKMKKLETDERCVATARNRRDQQMEVFRTGQAARLKSNRSLSSSCRRAATPVTANHGDRFSLRDWINMTQLPASDSLPIKGTAKVTRALSLTLVGTREIFEASAALCSPVSSLSLSRSRGETVARRPGGPICSAHRLG